MRFGARTFLAVLMLALGASGLGTTVLSDEVGPNRNNPNRIKRMRDALEILLRTQSGKEILAHAQKAWNESDPFAVLKKMKWGEASRTDAVLTRHYNPRTGSESRDRQVTVFLREKQSLEDLVFDIAHELVHATSRPSWDPYDPTLTSGKYIATAIEGEGGEVDAVLAECTVGLELSRKFGISNERCESYLKEGSQGLDREKVKRDFYRVGKWNEELGRKLGSERALFPLLTDEGPRLYSSTGNAPYPVALFKEFETITEIACENSRRRLSVREDRAVTSAARSTRAPASTQAFIARRCR